MCRASPGYMIRCTKLRISLLPNVLFPKPGDSVLLAGPVDQVSQADSVADHRLQMKVLRIGAILPIACLVYVYGANSQLEKVV